MINKLGKLLVLINLAASLVFMTLAGGIFLQQLDWGWKDPRKDITGTYRIPSEIDQRTVAVKDGVQAVELVQPPLKNNQTMLRAVEPWFAANHLWYRQQLAALESSTKPMQVNDVKYDKGVIALDPKAFGRPLLANPTGLTKSYLEMGEVLDQIHKNIDKAQEEIRALIEKEKQLTFQLNGKDNAGKDVGLLSLLEKEHQIQVKLKFEKEYLLPRWVAAVEELGLFQERQQRLDAALEKLKKARSGGGMP